MKMRAFVVLDWKQEGADESVNCHFFIEKDYTAENQNPKEELFFNWQDKFLMIKSRGWRRLRGEDLAEDGERLFHLSDCDEQEEFLRAFKVSFVVHIGNNF